MTKRSLLVALVGAALIPASATAAMNGQLSQTCQPAGQQAQTLCYGGDVIIRDGQALADPGRFEAAIEDYQRSWTHRTVAFQYSLANDVPFVNAPWLGTHNSFNSIAQQGPALSTTDANQQLTLVDQLRMDMRSLELDVHWFPSAYAGGQNAPVVCHAGAVSDHDGCSVEPLLGPVLGQIRGWLDKNPNQVLLLYIEDHLTGLDGSNGYDSTADVIKQSLGSLVYPTGAAPGKSVDLPLRLTRDKVLASGAQVVMVSNSHGGGGDKFRSQVFTWNSHVEQTPSGFQDFPSCGPDYKRSDYDTKLVRYYEDSTWLSAGASTAANDPEGEGLTPHDVQQMVRCGVDLFGFDQLQPGDGRLDASVWSWAHGEPSRHGCAIGGTADGWSTGNCSKSRPAACREADGSWIVTADAVEEADAAAACTAAGATFDVPRTGYDNERLKAASSGDPVWLGLERTRQGWRATTA